MADKTTFYQYNSDGISFTTKESCQIRNIYMPLCGADASSLKSSITPFLCGDIKLDKNHYVTKPVSTEDLRFYLRNFFCSIDGQGIVALAGRANRDNAEVEIGQLWHKFSVKDDSKGIELSSLNFIPVNGSKAEIMEITVKNISSQEITLTPTASIPLFARALSNKHDHEHVTSLLNRIEQISEGVIVEPSMLFDEEGHKECDSTYFVLGCVSGGELPTGTFPTTDSFYGKSGIVCAPEAVIKNESPKKLDDKSLQGKEAVGALRFASITLKPGEEKKYCLVVGIAENKKDALIALKNFNSSAKIQKALEEVKLFWDEKSSSICCATGDVQHDSWMRWVTLQPVLRRIFGCSFLPDHDYGKGGKGWRDIWQDLLSLILIEPDQVRETLVNNFAGIRIDGSNATIIGTRPGEFIADRNAITRVWMDHGAWPLMTLLLYIHQTGDTKILFETSSYFKDLQLSRTFVKDEKWSPEQGNQLKDESGKAYQGSIVEHLLLQNLVQFFNVGEHNITRLESADWNDGLDMAFSRGESVAFMSVYGGNLMRLANLLEELSEKESLAEIEVYKEMLILLDTISGEEIDYEDIEAKKELLFDVYCKAVQPVISGEKIKIKINDLASDLQRKAKWIFEHINKQEKVKEGKYSWFNGYYDNQGKRVEGKKDKATWMTLTGQVFPLMSGCADEKMIKEVVASVNAFLKDKELGGYRLNTDFGLRNYLDLGRAFGFAFGTKENGAFFSHMIVMYANALYSRGFAREGYEVLTSILNMCMDTEKSAIYPGIPEYFDAEGKGMYHYLTGAASWLVLTKLVEVFGVKGEWGDLILEPKLVKEEFSADGVASVQCSFAGKRLHIAYVNKKKKDFGEYTVQSAVIEGKAVSAKSIAGNKVRIVRQEIEEAKENLTIQVVLE